MWLWWMLVFVKTCFHCACAPKCSRVCMLLLRAIHDKYWACLTSYIYMRNVLSLCFWYEGVKWRKLFLRVYSKSKAANVRLATEPTPMITTIPRLQQEVKCDHDLMSSSQKQNSFPLPQTLAGTSAFLLPPAAMDHQPPPFCVSYLLLP